MAALTKNAIPVTVRDRAKWTKIWDHKGYRTHITDILKNSKFYKNKFKMADLTKNAISNNKYFQKFKVLSKCDLEVSCDPKIDIFKSCSFVVAHLRIYKKSLTASEITAIYVSRVM